MHLGKLSSSSQRYKTIGRVSFAESGKIADVSSKLTHEGRENGKGYPGFFLQETAHDTGRADISLSHYCSGPLKSQGKYVSNSEERIRMRKASV